MFLFANLGLDPAHSLLHSRFLARGRGDDINLCLFVYFFDVYRASYINDTQCLLELFLKFV